MKKYFVFWFSQSVSQLGSTMTTFALTLWTYEKTHSAMSVSMMSFCYFVTYVLAGLFAGAYVDRHNKKAIMLFADSVSAIGTVAVLALTSVGAFQVRHIYAVNSLIGLMGAFQQPASAIVVRRLVPKEKIEKIGGMNSISDNLVSVLSPVLTSLLYSFAGLKLVLIFDLLTFLFAFTVLLFFIHVPEHRENSDRTFFSDMVSGFYFLRREKGLMKFMLVQAVVIFLTMLTYENVLSPMIIARSGSNTALGIVSTSISVGGIIGGVIVTLKKRPKNLIKMIYMSACFSFLCGDCLMGTGRNVLVWCIAGLASGVPDSIIIAGQSILLYSFVPEKILGRVFAFRNTVQYSVIPVGLLLGGFLADSVFEPLMQTDCPVADFFAVLVGRGEGSGMAVMFLFTGVTGFLVSLLAYRDRDIRKLNNK